VFAADDTPWLRNHTLTCPNQSLNETHAFAVGAVAGLLGALTYGTPVQPAGLGIMLAVAATALGVKTSKRLRSKLTTREVSTEPWYAVGGLVLLFLLGALVRLVVL